MTMTPNERKAELTRRGRKMREIATALDVTPSHVSQVIAGKRRSPSVEQAVAAAMGKPVAKVFGAAA